MKEFRLLIWMTQLGISVAVPPALCISGALWLRNQFGLGNWVLFAGIGLGFYFAVNSFRASLKAMGPMDQSQKKDSPPPSVPFRDNL